MANRRMFSKDIVRSDAFLDLPVSSRELYFQLGMEADDRGYICNPKSIIRGLGATLGDLEHLVNKKFVLIRDEGLVLIKHWRINNYIQNDRFVETKFTDDLRKLFFDENNSYTEKETKTPCIQSVSKVYTQDSIGKDSVGKYRIVEDSKGKESIGKDKEINNDEPRFYESCYQKLVSKKFLSLEDYTDKDRYLELFGLLLEEYSKKNICISLNYFLLTICKSKWDDEKKISVPLGIRPDVTIENKYAYLRTALYKSCEQFKNGYESYTAGIEKRYLDMAIIVYDNEDVKKDEFNDDK